MLFLGSIAAVVWGLVPWGQCSFETADALLQEFDATDESPLARRVAAITKEFHGEVPRGQIGRIWASAPLCREVHPLGDLAPHLGAFVLLFLAGIFARNQSLIEESAAIEERETARRASVPTPIGAAMTLEPGQFSAVTGPAAIEVSDAFDLGLGNEAEVDEAEAERLREQEEESLMAFVAEKQKDQEEASEAEETDSSSYQIAGFYCPPGYQAKPVLYVDGASEAARDAFDDDAPINNPEQPFRTLEAAVEFATRRVVKDLPAIQIRLAPGIYQTSVVVPDRVVIVNHRLPAEGKPQKRLQWLAAQELDHPDRVTLLASSKAKFAIKFGAGANQGVYGCHIVGREGIPQVGIMAGASTKLTIFNCVIESFTRGGIRLEDSGAEIPGHGTNIIGSRIIGNSGSRGGGIHAARSSLIVRDSMIQRNMAHVGGAIWAEDMKTPLVIRATRFSHNVARAKTAPSVDVDRVKLDSWTASEGLGGAVASIGSRLKIVASEFVENKAQLAGGALALLNSKVVAQGDETHDVRLQRNKARIGGAVFAAGWHMHKTTLKFEGADIQLNEALQVGGAVASVGLSVVQFLDTKLAHNLTTEAKSRGAGVALLNGSEVIVKDCEIRENKSAGDGGAFAAINATLRILDECTVRDNHAVHSAGGVLFLTESNAEVEKMVSVQGFKLPFVFEARQCVISGNRAGDPGAGLCAGNRSNRASFPIGLKIDPTVRLRHNRTKHPDEAGDDIWVVWAGEVEATSKERPGEKMLLK